MEIGESVEQGALRETWEEACAEVEILRLFAGYSIPHIGQVYFLFLARLKNLNFSAGQETLETRLYSKEEVPWDQIAFSAVRFALEKYFSDPSSVTTHLGTFVQAVG
jgi:ADP-ribose pyrophosphatase YjhB (NUDIX family)